MRSGLWLCHVPQTFTRWHCDSRRQGRISLPGKALSIASVQGRRKLCGCDIAVIWFTPSRGQVLSRTGAGL